MKWPEEKTRWSLVTRTLYFSTMIATGEPGILRGQLYGTLPKKNEQAGGDQVGRRTRVAAVAVGAQPGIELGQRLHASFFTRPAPFQHGPGPAAGLLGLGRTSLACDKTVRMRSQQV